MGKKYEFQIEEEIIREKKEYLQYIENLGICRNVGVVDFGFCGTISYYLQKLLPETKIITYYFNGDFSIENRYIKDVYFKACFQSEEDINACNSEFRKYVEQNEAVYIAPYGMMERIEKQQIVTESTKVDFSINHLINEGVKNFIKDISNNQLCVDKEFILFIDEIFGYLNKTMGVTEQLMFGLYKEDSWTGLS